MDSTTESNKTFSSEETINQKCRICDTPTIGSDVCYKCLDNPDRKRFFDAIEEEKLGELEEKNLIFYE